MAIVFRVNVDFDKVERLKAAMREKPSKILDAVAGAINDTAKHTETAMSSRIRKKVNLKKDVVDKVIRRTTARREKLSAAVSLNKTARIGLKHFGARQTKHGVTYRIERDGGIKRIASGFGPNIPALSGNVFVRVGKARLPIRKLYGVSPWGVFVKGEMLPPTTADAQEFLDNRIEHRLQYQTKVRRKSR